MTGGGLGAGVVRKYVKRQLSGVLACYADMLLRKPETAGKIILGFGVGPAGAMLNARVTGSSFGDPVFAVCVEGSLAKWRFPAPVGGAKPVVSQPILLRAR